MENEPQLPKPTAIIVQATEWFADLALLNLLWLLFSLPIITIIPATESLFYVVYRLYKKDEKHPLKAYIKHFKKNLWLSMKRESYILVIFIVFSLNYLLISRSSALPEWMYLFTVSLVILFILFAISSTYYFALDYQVSVDRKKRWLLAFYLMLKFFSKTIVFILLTCMVGLLIFLWPSIGIFFSMSLLALFSTIVIEKDLKQLNKRKTGFS